MPNNQEKILKTEKVFIRRMETGFDKACDSAYQMAVALFGIDSYGHSSLIEEWDRSYCSIRVIFRKYLHSGGMGGHSHTYIFQAEAVKMMDSEDVD